MTDQQLEEIFRKNFNEGMPDIYLKHTTFDEFKRDYLDVLAVIIKSMREVQK